MKDFRGLKYVFAGPGLKIQLPPGKKHFEGIKE